MLFVDLRTMQSTRTSATHTVVNKPRFNEKSFLYRALHYEDSRGGGPAADMLCSKNITKTSDDRADVKFSL